ncbi:MAG TPA: hypothetical protein DC048_09620 [Planctomycetaceae bacterium]|nr:hypothetical protein [Planctomycetaceae bacterium]
MIPPAVSDSATAPSSPVFTTLTDSPKPAGDVDAAACRYACRTSGQAPLPLPLTSTHEGRVTRAMSGGRLVRLP